MIKKYNNQLSKSELIQLAFNFGIKTKEYFPEDLMIKDIEEKFNDLVNDPFKKIFGNIKRKYIICA